PIDNLKVTKAKKKGYAWESERRRSGKCKDFCYSSFCCVFQGKVSALCHQGSGFTDSTDG
ncbi:hypothetical protein, partial [Prevotella histicola]|uniref:hypothetical protein n=1 Tax=Prevotella histicola TaxID=470565 RepID=UPI0024203057